MPKAKGVGSGALPAFFGAILGSGVIAALVPLLPVYFPPHRNFEWVKAGVPPNDCAKDDTEATYSTPKPRSENCSAPDEGTIAVCWDGIEHKNAANPKGDPSVQWCTYKAISPDQCTGGASPGIMWVCKQVPKG